MKADSINYELIFPVKRCGNKLALTALCATLLAGCGQKGAGTTEARLLPKRVQVVPARQLNVEETVYGTGALAPQDRAVLSAKVMGRVEAMLVDLGTPVRQGDLLVQMQKRDFELRRQQAEAALWQARARLGLALTGEEDKAEPEKTSLAKEAKAVLGEATKSRERLMKLREMGIVPDADVEAAEAQYQVAVNRYEEAMHEAKNRIATLRQRKAEYDLAEQELKDTEVRAPFDGVVEQRQTSAGEFLNLATPIIAVVRIDPIRVRLEISEKDAPRIRLEDKVYVRVEGLEQRLEGRVTRLSPVISAGNRMLVAEADLPNPSGILRPGSFAKADIVVNERATGVFVPKNAIVTFAGIQKIFVVEKGKLVEKEVSLRRRRGEQVEVDRGVNDGDLVVIEPGGLRAGQPVEAQASDT